MNPPGPPEIVWFKLCDHEGLAWHGVVALSGQCWRSIPDGVQEAALLKQLTHSGVGDSTASNLLSHQGERQHSAI